MTLPDTQVQATVPAPRPASSLNEGAHHTTTTTRSTAGPPTAASGAHWSAATWLLLVVLCGALFLDALDLSMVGVALPSIGSSLHLEPSSLQWIVSGYILGYGGLMLLG